MSASSVGNRGKIREDKEEIGYIRVTMNGIAILFNTSPANLIGCYTEYLQTCVAIAIWGSKGVALIHDSIAISRDSIQNTCNKIGTIQHINFYYNSALYPGKPLSHDRLKETLSNSIIHIKSTIGDVSSDKRNLIGAPEGFVSVDREMSSASKLKFNFNISTMPSNLIDPVDIELRKEINVLNFFFLEEDEKIDADFQYDGEKFLDIPQFNKSLEQIEALRVLPKFSTGILSSVFPILRCRMTIQQIESYKTIQKQINARSISSEAKFIAPTTLVKAIENIDVKIESKKEHNLRGSRLDGFFYKKELKKEEKSKVLKKIEAVSSTIIPTASGVNSSLISTFFSKKDIIRILRKITPSICDAGFLWHYNGNNKQGWIIADDKNIGQMKAIKVHFESNNNGSIENPRYSTTKDDGKPVVILKILRNDLLKEIPTFRNPSISTGAAAVTATSHAKTQTYTLC